ncbi:GntR family transcriptional regulator [Amycolatopsis acidicola]|uniref:GntR family transcriptional regulator n=1 Tax=Amycolatopsis acidicola TaxID=2596893 RepID=A0A5N0VGV8_9PSEU|nr:GntR family transcriptional regulator [Amycolatopsis acidicola]KAA9164380.1 GntR family transcriptional regulator [Amycolatopsis acidicola]
MRTSSTARVEDPTEPAQTDPLVDRLLALITDGELSPGQRVDQRAISERLNVSRTPLREALKALESEGILSHEPNRGYTVTKLTASDLLQYHSLRFHIEGELVASIEWPDEEQLKALKKANDWYRAAGDSAEIGQMARANREFHFLLMSWSPLNIMFNELKRIWRITDAYHTGAFSTPERRKRVVSEHDAIVRAIEARSRSRLIKHMTTHSERQKELLADFIGPGMPAWAAPAVLPKASRS